MKIKDSVKGILLLMVAEQAAFALPPTISDFCLRCIPITEREAAIKEGNPIKEKGEDEYGSLWFVEKKFICTDAPNTEYQLKGLTPTSQKGNLITYDVDLGVQESNKEIAPKKFKTISMSLKLNHKGIVESIEEFNGVKTDTRENTENRLSLFNRHAALLLADFISTGGKHILRYRNSSRFITLKDERPNKQNPIAKYFNPEFPKAPHQ